MKYISYIIRLLSVFFAISLCKSRLLRNTQLFAYVVNILKILFLFSEIIFVLLQVYLLIL